MLPTAGKERRFCVRHRSGDIYGRSRCAQNTNNKKRTRAEYKMTERKFAMNRVQDEEKVRKADIILRIRLDTDDCEVVRMGSSEHDMGCGISEKASEWFRNYALRGYVHEDDLADYLLFTEHDAMRNWLDGDGGKKALTFRRRVDREFGKASLEILPDEEFSNEHPVALAVISPLPL
jgi:hypothetical protein